MKKTDFLLVGLVILLALAAFLSTKGTHAMNELVYPITLAGEIGSNEITYDEYKEMVDAEETFIVIIERATCSYCQMYMPMVKEVAEEKKIAINYIDTDNLADYEYQELTSTNKYLKKNQWGTPTTLLMYGNQIIDSIGGYVEKEEFEKFLEGRIKYGE